MLEKHPFVCVKCGNQTYTAGQFQATGGSLAKLLDVQNKKFTTISCTNCGYTEIYAAKTSAGMNILDFLTN